MEPPSSARVSVINQSGKKLPTALIKRSAELCLASSSEFNGQVCVLLTSDEEVQELNRRFRDIDEPTDVLTFPAQQIPGQEKTLGDIAISVPYATRQAAARGIKLEEELQYLAIHGALHLLGWNDETDDERNQMFAEMDRVGRLAGLPPEPEWCSLLHREVS